MTLTRGSTGANSVLNVRQTSTGTIAEFGTDSANNQIVFGVGGNITGSGNLEIDGNISGSASSTGSFGMVTVGSDGHETNPSFNFKTDGNTGFYLDSADDIGVALAGVEEFRFEYGGTFHADADVIAYSTTVSSDERLKTNVQSISGSLYKLKQLRPVEFDWLVDRDRHEYGLVAQEVEKVVPEIVVENKAIGDTKRFLKDLDGTGDFKTIDYSKLNVLLIDAIKEQQEQIDELKKEVEELKNGSS